MRSLSHDRGFTLIELLIVIAIMGILASILLANVLGARAQAQERSAQTYSAHVVKALTAVLAAESDLDAGDVVAGTYNCGAGAAATLQVVVSGETYEVGWPAAPGSVTGCSVAEVPGSPGMIDVEITTAESTYVNGAQQ